jgi:hypothetical protein
LRHGIPKVGTRKAKLIYRIRINSRESVLVGCSPAKPLSGNQSRTCVVEILCIYVGLINLRRIAPKKPHPVFYDSAAETRSREHIRAAGLCWMKIRRSRRKITGSRSPGQELTRTAVKLRHLKLKLANTVKVITATGGDRADHTAGRTAVFSSKTARFDLYFLNELRRNIECFVKRSGSIIRNFLPIEG